MARPEGIWWQAPCTGPYNTTCYERFNIDVPAHNLRLFQWCPRCLFEISINFGYRFEDSAGGFEVPMRPKLTK